MSKEPKVRSIGASLTAASANTIYTCPDNFVAKVILLLATNHGGGNKTISLTWTDSSASATYFIIGTYSLSAHSFLKFDGSYLVLNPGDTIIATPEAGSTIDAIITVEEYYEQGLF